MEAVVDTGKHIISSDFLICFETSMKLKLICLITLYHHLWYKLFLYHIVMCNDIMISLVSNLIRSTDFISDFKQKNSQGINQWHTPPSRSTAKHNQPIIFEYPCSDVCQLTSHYPFRIFLNSKKINCQRNQFVMLVWVKKHSHIMSYILLFPCIIHHLQLPITITKC